MNPSCQRKVNHLPLINWNDSQVEQNLLLLEKSAHWSIRPYWDATENFKRGPGGIGCHEFMTCSLWNRLANILPLFSEYDEYGKITSVFLTTCLVFLKWKNSLSIKFFNVILIFCHGGRKILLLSLWHYQYQPF